MRSSEVTRSPQTFSVKRQKVSTLGFEGHTQSFNYLILLPTGTIASIKQGVAMCQLNYVDVEI